MAAATWSLSYWHVIVLLADQIFVTIAAVDDKSQCVYES